MFTQSGPPLAPPPPKLQRVRINAQLPDGLTVDRPTIAINAQPIARAPARKPKSYDKDLVDQLERRMLSSEMNLSAERVASDDYFFRILDPNDAEELGILESLVSELLDHYSELPVSSSDRTKNELLTRMKRIIARATDMDEWDIIFGNVYDPNQATFPNMPPGLQLPGFD